MSAFLGDNSYGSDCVSIYDYGDDQYKCVDPKLAYDGTAHIDIKRNNTKKAEFFKRIEKFRKEKSK